MICSCCGYKIEDQPHAVDNGKKYVCDKCWNNPDLFFPEKLHVDSRLRLISEIMNETRNQSDSIKVKVIRLLQKDIEMYIGKMRSRDILELYEIDKFKEEELRGYQREQYEERTSELIEYLAKCPAAIMPSLFVSLREARFVPEGDDLGILEISRKRGSIWIIDGQHRIGGFKKVRDCFIFGHNPIDIDPNLFKTLMNYELPVVFIDTRKATENVKSINGKGEQNLTPEDLERSMFFIVNKTQKGISPSLKDALLYRISIGGIEGIPMLRKENWRVMAAHIVISLNRDEDSPLRDKINISGRKGTGKPIQLNSFISSLKPLLNNVEFSKLSNDNRLKFVKAFWSVLKKMFPDAFGAKTWKEYMILKAIGVYCLNWLASDIFMICSKKGNSFDIQKILEDLLKPLGLFDWKSHTSPLSALGGMKGAHKGYDILRKTLQIDTSLLSVDILSLDSFFS